MAAIRELYQDLILDHGRKPRNHHELADATGEAEGNNPLCGDHVTVYVRLEGDTIADVSFEGDGCAISTASASILTQEIKGKTVEDARDLAERVHEMLAGDEDLPDPDELGKIAVLAGVKDFPTRVKCATLAWHTLEAALQADGKATGSTVSTEA